MYSRFDGFHLYIRGDNMCSNLFQYNNRCVCALVSLMNSHHGLWVCFVEPYTQYKKNNVRKGNKAKYQWPCMQSNSQYVVLATEGFANHASEQWNVKWTNLTITKDTFSATSCYREQALGSLCNVENKLKIIYSIAVSIKDQLYINNISCKI